MSLKADILTQINTTLPDNTTLDITPEILRNMFIAQLLENHDLVEKLLDDNGNLKHNGVSLRTQSVTISGRQYLSLNTWRGWNGTYGFAYYQFSQTFGSGALPVHNYTHNGITIPNVAVIDSLAINGRLNSAEVFEMEICITALSFDDESTVVNIEFQEKFTFETYSTKRRKLNFPINKKVPANSEIHITMRKKSGSGSTRYFYHNLNLNYTILNQ